jgi:hypothetical protein
MSIILPNGRAGGWRRGLPDPVNDVNLSRRLGATKRRAPVNPSLNPTFFPRIRDQLHIGSCGGHALRNCMAYLLRERLGEKLQGKWGEQWDLSPLAAYYLGRVEEGPEWAGQDAGVIIKLAVQACRVHGIPTEESWPYDPRKFARRPSKKALETGKWHQASPASYRCDEDGDRHKTIDRMLQGLEAGMPLNFGFSVYDNIGEADVTGVLPPPRGSNTGGHNITAYAADTTARVFIGPNSWGNQIGAKAPPGSRYDERGYVITPFQYVLDGLADDIHAMELEDQPE